MKAATSDDRDSTESPDDMELEDCPDGAARFTFDEDDPEVIYSRLAEQSLDKLIVHYVSRINDEGASIALEYDEALQSDGTVNGLRGTPIDESRADTYLLGPELVWYKPEGEQPSPAGAIRCLDAFADTEI